jgi:hypothetical protein
VRNIGEISNARITATLDRTLDCLRQHYRVSEAGAGWYHYLDDPSPGVTASAVGLFTFHKAGRQFEHTDRVVHYLTGQQIHGPDEHRGGWAVRTTHGFPLVESTAWVLRALSHPGTGLIEAGSALEQGADWLTRNQNTDFGWGSYRGQTSRVFTTSLAMAALQECGGNQSAIDNAQKWLVDAQSAQLPAWGPFPGAEPTSLHTAIALLALLNQRGALGTNAINQSAEWLLERLNTESHCELITTVEEYDIPYIHNGASDVFQNSLPHFAGPMALTAILSTGLMPLNPKIFRVVQYVIGSQLELGHWELPRSPTRPSIWAVHPFVQALAAARAAIVPTPASEAVLLYPGCAIVQSVDSNKKLTRNLLLRNALFDWLRRRKVAVALWVIALCATLVACLLLVTNQIKLVEFVISLIFPIVLMIFHLLWERRSKSQLGDLP